jgi:hypothetical protein
VRAISGEHATLLSQKGWLSNTPNDFQRDFLNACLCYDLGSGQAITHGGEVTGGVFGIIAGTAGVFSTVSSPEVRLIHIAGRHFGSGFSQ